MKKVSLKKFVVLLIPAALIISAAFLYSCSCSSCGKDEEPETVPVELLEKSDRFIKAKTGNEFFQNYITPDFNKTQKLEDGYLMVYRLFIPEKPYVDNFIRFTIDSTGSVDTNREVVGIPNCASSPSDCDFKIDQRDAEQIAESTGLPPGVKDWDVGFIWDAEFSRYVWHVISTFNESGSEENYRANGKELIIDPVNGEVLTANEWKIN